jgi:hypothetical protein
LGAPPAIPTARRRRRQQARRLAWARSLAACTEPLAHQLHRATHDSSGSRADQPRAATGGMDSPTTEGGGGQLLHSLNAVVNFLHTEGFYAAGGHPSPLSLGAGPACGACRPGPAPRPVGSTHETACPAR